MWLPDFGSAQKINVTRSVTRKIKTPKTMRLEGKQDTGIEPIKTIFLFKPVTVRKSLENRLVTGFSYVNI